MNVKFIDQDGDKIEIRRSGSKVEIFLDGEFVTRYEDGNYACRLWYSKNHGLLRITGPELVETDLPISQDMINTLLKILPTLDVQEQDFKGMNHVDTKTQFRKSMIAAEVASQLEHINISHKQQHFAHEGTVNIESSSLAKRFDDEEEVEARDSDAKYGETEDDNVADLELVKNFTGLEQREHRANSELKRETEEVDKAKVVKNFAGLQAKKIRRDSNIARETSAIKNSGIVTEKASIFGDSIKKRSRKPSPRPAKDEHCALKRRKSSRRFSQLGIG